MGLFVALIFVVAIAVLLVLPVDAVVAGIPAQDVIAQSLYGLVAVLLIASLTQRYRGRWGAVLRDLALWSVIVSALLVGYTYRDAISPIADRVMAEINPGTVVTRAPETAEVVRRRDGHFLLKMRANGRATSFVFDTGATTVVLRAEDAAAIGIDTSKLAYTTLVRTANGTTRAAETRIETLEVGGITQTRVTALVARAGTLTENLLGQSFLERLAGYSVEGNKLILRGPTS